jgi:hypothetical protein
MTAPLVSVVLALDSFATGKKAIAALRGQTIADRLELVLAGPDLEIPASVRDGFESVSTVDVPVEPLSAARAAAIGTARAPTVFVAETHGFPRPDCLQRLAAAVGSGAAAAVPRLVNANPETLRSWASLFSTYGAFTGTVERRLAVVPLHNAAFDRAVLAPIARRPEDLVYGVGVTDALRAAGAEMRYVPEAVIDHQNVVRPGGILMDRLVGGRLWAGVRSRHWSTRRRALHAVGTPLAPAMMVGRIIRSDGWQQLRRSVPRGTAAAIVLFAALQALGELAGYVGGVGASEGRHVDLELHREDFM